MPNVDPSTDTRPAGVAPQNPQAAAHRAPRKTDVTPALDQTFDEEGLFTLRSAVAAHTSALGGSTVLDDMVLVAHELSSNAVRHGGGSGRLRLWQAGGHLYCEVSDNGAGLSDPERAGTSRPSPSVPGGRGLWIARQMSQVEIRSTPEGTTITVAIPLR